jgi:hypothetical protein
MPGAPFCVKRTPPPAVPGADATAAAAAKPAERRVRVIWGLIDRLRKALKRIGSTPL